MILAVLSHPHDRAPFAPPMHLAADHAAISKEAPHKLLVDDHYLKGRGVVAQVEIAPFHQRYLHGLEVTRRNQFPVDLHTFVWARNVALHLKRFPVSAAKSQRRRVVVADGGHSGLPLQLLTKTAAITVGLPRIITGRGKIEARQRDALGLQSR